MSLTRTQVEGIAHLARLEITEAQMPVYVDSLSRIIDFVEQLAAAETAGVEPMAHPLADQVQRLRPDAVTETDQRDKFQRNAAERCRRTLPRAQGHRVTKPPRWCHSRACHRTSFRRDREPGHCFQTSFRPAA